MKPAQTGVVRAGHKNACHQRSAYRRANLPPPGWIFALDDDGHVVTPHGQAVGSGASAPQPAASVGGQTAAVASAPLCDSSRSYACFTVWMGDEGGHDGDGVVVRGSVFEPLS
jgi:hypothetical protein